MKSDDTVKIEHVSANGEVKVLKESLKLLAGEVLDASCMSAKKLEEFFIREIEEAKSMDVLLSLHMKATMMKVSDPIIFGHCVRVFFKNVFDKHAATFAEIGVNPNNGWGDCVEKINKLPADKKK